MDAWEYILIWVGFLFVSVAASQLAVIFPKIKLPLITGYLVVGIFAGPYVLDFLTKADLPRLAPVNQFVLAYIGFSAGAELYLPELRDLFKTIFLSVAAISVLTFGLVTGVVRLLLETSVASFATESLGPGCLTGIALLIGAIMTARSPASAIAIAKEMKAKGPFTRTFLGITVVSDVVVLVLFAISVAFARGQCTSAGFSGESVLTLVASLTLAVVLGYFALGKLIVLLLYLMPNSRLPPKWLILPIGFGIFKLSEAIADATLDGFGLEINLEPLLMTIVAGYVATNQSKNRRLFLSMLQKVGPYVFIPFFTLTGSSLDLSVLLQSAVLAVIITVIRMIAIGAGSVIGGVLAKSPKVHTTYMWLSLITQAGVSLGLAAEINFMFHDSWGPSCATSIVAVIMLNQIIGPILCKISIKKVGEHGKAKGNEDEEGKSILILGINGYSLALAERLRSSHWKVTMADTNPTKLPYALKLNSVTSGDPHAQLSDAHAIQKKKKDLEPVELNADFLTPTEKPASPKSTHIPPPPPLPPTAHVPTHAPTPAAAEAGAHVEEHEIIHDIVALQIQDLDKSTDTEAMVTRWNYRDLAQGLHPRNDVVLCMLEIDSANVSACSFFKLQMKFLRVIGSVNSPATLDMYLRTGALPFYTFSASISTLFNCVTASHLKAANLASMITPEAEGYPHNLELLPFLRPLPDDETALEAIELNANLIDLDIDSTPSSHPPPPPPPSSSSNPVTRIGEMVRGGFNTTQARLRELRDPVGMVQRGVDNMHVVEDAQRDEYLDSLEGLGDATYRPVTANSIWMDLLSPSSQQDRRVVSASDDPSAVRSTFRTDMSVFEEYNDIRDNQH